MLSIWESWILCLCCQWVRSLALCVGGFLVTLGCSPVALLPLYNGGDMKSRRDSDSSDSGLFLGLLLCELIWPMSWDLESILFVSCIEVMWFAALLPDWMVSLSLARIWSCDWIWSMSWVCKRSRSCRCSWDWLWMSWSKECSWLLMLLWGSDWDFTSGKRWKLSCDVFLGESGGDARWALTWLFVSKEWRGVLACGILSMNLWYSDGRTFTGEEKRSSFALAILTNT